MNEILLGHYPFIFSKKPKPITPVSKNLADEYLTLQENCRAQPLQHSDVYHLSFANTSNKQGLFSIQSNFIICPVSFKETLCTFPFSCPACIFPNQMDMSTHYYKGINNYPFFFYKKPQTFYNNIFVLIFL